MKHQFIFQLLTVLSLFLITSCGEKSSENKTEQISKREVNKTLDTLISDLSNCEQQNTNCEAYSKASEGIQTMCNDETERNKIVADLFYMIQIGPSPKTQAAAHAVNFWTRTSSFKTNPEYGRVVLNALKKEKYDDNNYTGSQLGQLLSNWFETEDDVLLTDIVNAMKDKSLETRGRTELVRLSSNENYKNKKIFDAIVSIIKDENEELSMRNQALSVIWRAGDEEMKKTVKSIYEDMLKKDEIKLSGPSLTGLSYMKSFDSYEVIVEAIRANKGNKYWYSHASNSLRGFIDTKSEKIDLSVTLELIKELMANKEIEANYRSYFISPLSKINTAASKQFLKQLSNSSEKSIADKARSIK